MYLGLRWRVSLRLWTSVDRVVMCVVGRLGCSRPPRYYSFLNRTAAVTTVEEGRSVVLLFVLLLVARAARGAATATTTSEEC